MRVGIYSGAFDPVHDGHTTFALEAALAASLDKVFFLVEPRPRYKQGVKAHEHRVAMVQLAIKEYPGLSSIIVDQPEFSVLETWPVLQRRFKGAELSMLMGEDIFARLAKWPRVDSLITSAEFIVGLRTSPGAEATEHLKMIAQTRALQLNYQVFQPSAPKFNSTDIRSSLRQGKIPAGLNRAVAAYISANQLYSSEYANPGGL